MTLSPMMLMLLGELLLISVIVSIVMITRALMGRKRNRAAATALADKVKKNQEQRQEQVRKLVKELQGIKDDQAEDLINRIHVGELSFYQALVDGFFKGNAGALTMIRSGFEAATEPYRTLQPVVPEPEVDHDREFELVAELDELRQEKDRITEELKITMDTMGSMLSEYAAMYSGGATDDMDMDKIADMYRTDDTEGESLAVDDTMPPAEEETEPAGVDDSEFPVPDQDWIDEAMELPADSDQEDTKVDISLDDDIDDILDQTKMVDASDFMDDLVSLDLESGVKG
ncbi:MAG: hypothetical protein GY703_07415 [Gammaproteobacteria bacterium]|nr:hypothetical protein [Gammaproteobacteria bacterium]